MTAKLIQEVVYMENTMETTVGSRLPEALGSLYQLTENYIVVGQKMALLLREKGFTFNDFERLTIVLSESVPMGESVLSERITDKWMRYVDYGVARERLNALSADEQEEAVLVIAQNVFKALFADTEEKAAMVDAAVEDIRANMEEIDIVYQSKQDKTVKVETVITLFRQGHCRIMAKVYDTADVLLTEQLLSDCDNLQQALQYSGTILIRKNRVVIKPINNVMTKELQPIEIPFELV